MLNELANLFLMLTAMTIGAFFWLFELLVGEPAFGGPYTMRDDGQEA